MRDSTPRLRVFIALLAITTAPAIAGQPVKSKPIDHSTPQKVAAEITEAFKQGDWKRASACMTWKSRGTVLGFLILTAAIGTAGDEAKQKSFQELGKILGILKKEDPEKLFKDSDKVAAACAAIEQWQRKNLPKVNGKPQPTFSEKFGALKYVNFKVQGDVARADAIEDGKQTPGPAYFKRIEGKWYMDFYRASQDPSSSLKVKFRKKQ